MHTLLVLTGRTLSCKGRTVSQSSSRGYQPLLTVPLRLSVPPESGEDGIDRDSSFCRSPRTRSRRGWFGSGPDKTCPPSESSVPRRLRDESCRVWGNLWMSDRGDTTPFRVGSVRPGVSPGSPGLTSSFRGRGSSRVDPSPQYFVHYVGDEGGVSVLKGSRPPGPSTLVPAPDGSSTTGSPTSTRRCLCRGRGYPRPEGRVRTRV